MTVLVLSLFRTDLTYPNGQSEVVHNMEWIASLLENLQIRDNNAPPWRSARERKPNARYFNNKTLTNLINDWDIAFILKLCSQTTICCVIGLSIYLSIYLFIYLSIYLCVFFYISLDVIEQALYLRNIWNNICYLINVIKFVAFNETLVCIFQVYHFQNHVG